MLVLLRHLWRRLFRRGPQRFPRGPVLYRLGGGWCVELHLAVTPAGSLVPTHWLVSPSRRRAELFTPPDGLPRVCPQ